MRTLGVLVGLGLLAGVAAACPFCNAEAGKTLVEEAKEARVVVYGRLVKADETKEESEIAIEKLIKDDPARPKGDTLTIRKYLDPNLLTDKDRVMLFCDFYKGKVDAYRGLVVKKGSRLPEYLEGSRARAEKPMPERLKFCFDYLDDADLEVSGDAYKVFARCDYKDFKDMATGLPADRVLKWLKDPATPKNRLGLFASMLGHCGKAEHADEVRKLLDDPDRRSTGIDGLLAAHVLLKPRQGMEYIRNVLKNPKEDFMYRYAALRAVRFLNDYRADLVPKKDLVPAVCLLLDQDDISDMAIEDLRKWKQWDVAGKVVAVSKRPGFNEQTVVKRSLLRYCIQAQGSPEAAAYLAKRKSEDPEVVKDAEELLEIENPSPKSTPKR